MKYRGCVMRLRASVLLLALTGTLLELWPSAARACSCAPPPPPLEAAERATFVFEGRPRNPVREGSRVRYTFDVTRVFKGSYVPTVEIVTPSSGAACGRSYEPFRAHLIYAHALGGGTLSDGLCSRSRLSSQAGPDFAALGNATAYQPDSTFDDETSPPDEPPRIAAMTPPPIATAPERSRGCSVAEPPHGMGSASWLGLGLLGIAAIRRRAVG